jgi:ParB-like nuclease domain
MTKREPESKVELVRLLDIRPCPENDGIYAVPSMDDPDILALIRSIRENGLLEPIHISADNVIISGHRRRFCSLQAGLRMVPAIRGKISYADDREAFLKLLVEANTQRKKTAGMLLREAAMKVDPAQAYEELKQEQREKDRARRFDSSVSDQQIESKNVEGRKIISKAKKPFLDAALRVIREHEEFWPLSVRQIHYRLLGSAAPLKHASKPGSAYINDKKSYQSLCDLLARGRIEGLVPWQAIDDETRPEMLNNHYCNTGQFFESEIDGFLRGFVRNRQQSQPHHIEIIAEKLTVKTILESVAEAYSIPLTISRGMSGPTVKKKIADRYRRSKKEKLILLVVADLDPAGDAIAQDIRDAFERDFGIHSSRIEVYKVALNIEQVWEMDLEPSMEAKDSSPTYDAFIDRYGITDAYELEALEPGDLQRILEDAIDEVMNMDAYWDELEEEKTDAVGIATTKRMVVEFLKTAGIDARTES